MCRTALISFFVAMLCAWASVCLQQAAAAPKAGSDPIIGLWYTEGHEGGVELYSCGDKICGKFYWVNQRPGEGIAKDDHNPDLTKRHRLLCHMQFMGDFIADGHGHYEDGWIYSPRHGQNFEAEMTLVGPDTLDLHGFVLTPIFGESQTWTRTKTMPNCKDAS